MKRSLTALSLLLLTGCSVQPAATPAPAPAASEPKLVAVPTPEEMCQKPADDSGIIIGLAPGDSDSEIGIKPGWTRPFPARWFLVSLRFDKRVKVDPNSFRVKAEPGRWQPSDIQSIGKPDWMHTFQVLPDGTREQPGPPGWVTVTVEAGKDLNGQPLVKKPISVRLFMEAPLKPGEQGIPCPTGDLIPPPVGGH